jgi:hypothetical protein
MKQLLALTLCVSILIPTASLAQPAKTDAWSRVQDLGQGSKVRVTLRDGAQVVGRILQGANDVLTLYVDSPTDPGGNVPLDRKLTISRSNVSEVAHLKMPKWAKGLIWGSVAFAISAAVLVAYALDCGC